MSTLLAEPVLTRRSSSLTNKGKYPVGARVVLPKVLDERLRPMHRRLGIELTQLSDKQAEYLGVKKEGPYKPEYYRY